MKIYGKRSEWGKQVRAHLSASREAAKRLGKKSGSLTSLSKVVVVNPDGKTFTIRDAA